MSITTVAQIRRASDCQSLLALEGLTHLWTARGPTREASRLLVERGLLSVRARLVLKIAWAIWKGQGGPTFIELCRLPAKHRQVLAKLMLDSDAPSPARRDSRPRARGRILTPPPPAFPPEY